MKRLDLSDLSFLIIDDSSYMRKILRTLLSGYGVKRVFEADSADNGMTTIKSNMPDIVLCDWEMPEKNGIEFLKELRGSPDKHIRFLPVMFVSGHSERSRVNLARDAGANDYLVKPVSATTLYNHITTVVMKDIDYIDTGAYFGPDRRWKDDENYEGEERRANYIKNTKDDDDDGAES